MDRAKPYLKVAALLSAVALVGALVAYRAGAFSTPVPSEAPGDPQPTAVPRPTAEQLAPTPDPHPALMYGSKSAPAFLPGESAQALGAVPGPVPVTPTSPDKPPTFIGGSKSIILVPAGQLPGLTPSHPPNMPPPTPPGAPKP
ncbi:hypothetical protein [Frigoriglobus tundricola]|uniref:Uncharacterized protein n=1 Tax=Frigoriglobus tundricola TaxID=2774151 RepID=A0A6M5YS22_9BACT|nr:hypothetical protein [Frigoriglobus tundricola]QJW96061.1 hypothetical protein FTUN_3615 [Frigoriglobus tundricola]